MREYRARLIADVVTGKVNVREVAAQLPKEPELAEDEIVETVVEADQTLDAENVEPTNEEAASDDET